MEGRSYRLYFVHSLGLAHCSVQLKDQTNGGEMCISKKQIPHPDSSWVTTPISVLLGCP